MSPPCDLLLPGRLRYADGVALQKDLVRRRAAGEIPDTLVLLEHESVVTLGKLSKREHVLADDTRLAAEGVELHESERGGDVTWHGPGQLVGYPIVDLSALKRDVKWYVERLEEVMIRVAARHGIVAGRAEGMTGAWVGDRKLGAIGVRVERWITSHGFALNVSPDLSAFGLIIPCGLRGRGVTSIAALLERPVGMEGIFRDVAEEFGLVFDRQVRPVAGRA